MSDNPYEVTPPSDQPPANPYDARQGMAKQIKQGPAGGSWFYWIAGLSLVNSIMVACGSDWNFIVGLGATQIIDGVASIGAEELGGDGGTVVRVIGLAMSATVAGVFFAFGLLARRRHVWAIILGMVLYAFDGLIFLLFGQMLAVGFHVFVLFGLRAELRSVKSALATERLSEIVQTQQATI